MFKDAEVLSFEVEFDQKNKVSVLEKLDHFDKAPYGMKEDSSIEQLNAKLFGFFNFFSNLTFTSNSNHVIHSIF